MTERGKRQHNRPWKGVYGLDRAYTLRVDTARTNGNYTPKGTPDGHGPIACTLHTCTFA